MFVCSDNQLGPADQSSPCNTVLSLGAMKSRKAHITFFCRTNRTAALGNAAVDADHSSRHSRRQHPIGRADDRLAQSGQVYPECPEPAVAASITAQWDMKFQDHSRDPIGRAVLACRSEER